MSIIKEWLINYGGEILTLVITAVFTFLGTAAKNILKQIANDKEKREVVKDVVKAVEQMFKDLHGKDKLEKAVENASIILSEKGITITELELLTLIESAVSEFNDAFNKASWEEGLKEATSSDEILEAIEVEAVELETSGTLEAGEVIKGETAEAMYNTFNSAY